MAKKTVSQKRAQRLEQESISFQKTLNVCLLGLIAEFYLLLVNRYYINGRVSSMLSWHRVLQVGMYAGIAVFALGLVRYAMLAKKDGGSTRCKKLSFLLSIMGAFFAGSGFVVIRYFDRGTLLLSAAVPVITVLALIFLLLPFDCFLSTTLLSLSFGAVWICRQSSGTAAKILTFGVAVVLLLSTIAASGARAAGGRIGKYCVFPADCNYVMLALVSLLCVVSLLLVMLVPASAVYLQWVIGILTFCNVVYHTVKMM